MISPPIARAMAPPPKLRYPRLHPDQGRSSPSSAHSARPFRARRHQFGGSACPAVCWKTERTNQSYSALRRMATDESDFHHPVPSPPGFRLSGGHDIRQESTGCSPSPTSPPLGAASRPGRPSGFGDRRPDPPLDALVASGVNLTAAFGPQHGLRGDKQDNMMESPDYHRSGARHSGIQPLWRGAPADRPVDGDVRTSWSTCRTSAAASTPSSRRCSTCSKPRPSTARAVWVLDRPNPAGRPVEGLTLRAGWESFVGAGPMPMRHGLTLGELGHWFIDASSSTSITGSSRWTAGSRRGAGLRLAARRAGLGQPEPQCAEPLDGALPTPAR